MASLTQSYNPSPPTPALPASYTPSPTHPPPAAPPPPPPGPPTHPHTHPHSHPMPATAPGEAPVVPRKGQVPLIPMSDARSDLLAAIRRGQRCIMGIVLNNGFTACGGYYIYYQYRMLNPFRISRHPFSVLFYRDPAA